MAVISPAQFANRNNKAFKDIVANASIIVANTQIAIGQVAPNTAGYQAYKKRTELAAAVIRNPDQYASAFAAELLVAVQTAADEIDPNNLVGPITTAWDQVAGVTQNDINL
jgi:cation transporter-like permease